MTFWKSVGVGVTVGIILMVIGWAKGILPLPSFLKSSPPVSKTEPPRLEINPSPANIEVGCGLKADEKGREVPIWQFQTSITVTRPASIPTGKAFIRTCFFTGRKDNWTSKIPDWTPSCLRDPIYLTSLGIKAMISKRCQGHHIKPYQAITGPLRQYRATHGAEIATKECKPERVWRFKPGEPFEFEHLVYPDLANNPWTYLCDGNAMAYLFVRLILEDGEGHRQEPYDRYLPIQCGPDYIGPKNGEPSKNLFQWADKQLKEPPPGVNPPPWCILQLPKAEGQ